VNRLSELLLMEKDRTASRVIGAAINSLRWWEVEDYDKAYAVLKAAVTAHQIADRAYIASLKETPESLKETLSSPRKEDANAVQTSH
jgi:hypothetical protein